MKKSKIQTGWCRHLEIQCLPGERFLPGTATKVAVPGDGAIQGRTENDSLQGSTENDSLEADGGGVLHKNAQGSGIKPVF